MALERSINIEIPSLESPTEIAGAPNGGDDKTVIQSDGLDIGSSSNGLRLESILNADVLSEGPSYEIDVVHVLGVAAEQQVVDSSELIEALPIDARKREFRFEVDLAGLLFQDAQFTTRYVESKARQLLSGLRHFCRFGDGAIPKVIIFTAYDIGAVVLKLAISIASKQDYECPEIFKSITHIALVGCFQREDDLLGMKLLSFLYDTGKDAEWKTLITLESVRSLVAVVKLANTAFLDCKVSLQSIILSVCAGASGGHIHSCLDYATATIGISTEVTMQEEDLFPVLGEKMSKSIDRYRISNPSFIPLEMTMLSLIPPSVQMRSREFLPDHPVLSSTAYQSWFYRSGVQILYIGGPDVEASTVAAEQVGMDWVKRHQKSYEHDRLFFQFHFDKADPQKRFMASALAASISQFFKSNTSYKILYHEMLQEQYKIQNAWTDDELLNFAASSRIGMIKYEPHVLRGVDECDVRSRRKFWDRLGGIASRLESPVKIVVTANDAGIYTSETLRDELKDWPEVNLLECEASHSMMVETESDNDFQNALLPRLCPMQMDEEKMRGILKQLEPMDSRTIRSVLHVAETYSRWPSQKSCENLSVFLKVTESMTPSSTPQTVLWGILRSIQEQEWLACVLTWMIHGHRPMTRTELASIVSIQIKGHGASTAPPDDYDIHQCLEDIETRIRGFASVDNDTLRLRPDILGLMTDETEKYWTTINKEAPRLTAEFLLEYLKLPSSHERLRVLNRNYQERVQRSGDSITPPMTPDGRDFIFYAVHALPQHLSSIDILARIREEMEDVSGPYAQWAKAYWAMSNPFSRPAKGPLQSAWRTWEACLEFESLKSEKVQHTGTLESRCTPMESLIQAVRGNDEVLSLVFAQDIVSDFSNGKESTGIHMLEFPQSIVWRATWLGMDRLLDLILRKIPQLVESPSYRCPSMLYLASNLGHPKVVDILLSHNANINVRNRNNYTPFFTACLHGHVEVVRSLLKTDPESLDRPQPDIPLYAATCWGFWKCVEFLLEEGADPNLSRNGKPEPSEDGGPHHGWTPITASCSDGHVKTVQLLLKHGAKPNTAGPSGSDTCIWFAAMNCHSLEIMQLLLENGADPNHELLDPPILSEIITNDEIPEDTKIKMFDLLFENDRPVDLERGDRLGLTALMVAGRSGNQSAVQWLLSRGASINSLDSNNCSVLFHTIRNKNWDLVHYLLAHDEKPRLDLVSTAGETMLELAMDHIDELKTLLDAKADPNLEDSDKRTLLNIAVAAQNKEVVELLLEPARRVDVHHRDDAGWSPIMDSTGFSPNAEIATLLLEAGARLSDTTSTGYRPLHLAADQGRPDVLRALLYFREASDIFQRAMAGQTPLLAVNAFTEKEGLECIRVLVRAGADINDQNDDGDTLLILSVEVGVDARAVQDWLLAQPNIDIHLKAEGKGTALHLACKSADFDLARKLLEKGADPNAKYMALRSTPLIEACMSAASNDSDDLSPKTDNVERLVRALIAKGADASATCGISIFNALSAAALCAEIGTINFLLDMAVSVRTADPLGRLPIHFAAANGSRNFETVASAHGSDIMIPDRFNKNSLHWAAQMGKAKTVKAILQRLSPRDKKVYVNEKDCDGWTPLAWASRLSTTCLAPFWTRSEPQNYEATIQCLIDSGADKSVHFRMSLDAGAEELTPLKMAKRCLAGEVILQLLSPEDASSEKAEPEPVYRSSDGFCGFCLAQSRAIMHSCETCSGEKYAVCSKCYPTAIKEHVRTATFEGPHTFVLSLGGDGEEFETVYEPSAKAESVVNGDTGEAGDNGAGQHSNLSTPNSNATTFHGDYIKPLDLPDLRDIGSLDDL